MTTAQRREEILALLNQADAPIAAKDLAARFGVSRQVIVQDLAVIRASRPNIISTNRGYILQQQETGCLREFKVRHTPEQAEQLFMVTVDLNIPVICYGLRADFSLKGFPGSTRLLELAHTIEEMKTICTCGRKAICNCRKVNGRFVFEGEQVAIDLENDVQYVSMCPHCYFKAKRAFYAEKAASQAD